MTSIYQQAMGAEFDRLHPEIQQRFAITSAVALRPVRPGSLAVNGT